VFRARTEIEIAPGIDFNLGNVAVVDNCTTVSLSSDAVVLQAISSFLSAHAVPVMNGLAEFRSLRFTRGMANSSEILVVEPYRASRLRRLDIGVTFQSCPPGTRRVALETQAYRCDVCPAGEDTRMPFA